MKDTRLKALEKYFKFVSPPDDEKDLPAFFSFCLPRHKALMRWPNYPESALPKCGLAASGSGLTKKSCRKSGLGEAIEIASICAWGDEPFLRGSLTELGSQAVPPSEIYGISSWQIAERETWNASDLGALDRRASPLSNDQKVDWMKAHCAITGEIRWIAADQVLVARLRSSGQPQWTSAGSEGCAAGKSPTDAKLRAVLELLERDATARWWYGGIPAAKLPLEVLNSAAQLRTYFLSKKRKFRLLNLGTEFGVPTVAAISYGADGKDLALGAAARFDLEDATVTATTELLQCELGIAQRLRAGDTLTKTWCGADHLAHLRFSSANPPEIERNVPQSKRAKLGLIAQTLYAAGHSLYFVNLTRSAFNVPVFRAISPGLCSIKPRLGKRRLKVGKNVRVHNTVPLLV